MASPNPNSYRVPMYPQVIDPSAPPIHSSSFSLYPTIDMNDLNHNFFPDSNHANSHRSSPDKPSAPPDCVDETLIAIPGAILHLIDKNYSVELATGDLRIVRLRQGDDTLAALATVSDDVQWPLTADITSVKLDSSHYFFSFSPPGDPDHDEDAKKGKKKPPKKHTDENEMLSYGLTIASKGQEANLKELDGILEAFSNFSVQKVDKKAAKVLEGAAAGMSGATVREISPSELKADDKKKAAVEGQCAAYWTTLAPNVEDYSGTTAKLIASGSGKLVKGVLWCGDVTMDRLNRGHDVWKEKMTPGQNKEVDPSTLRRIKRVKRVTQMTEKVATGVLSGVVKVSGFFTGSLANSKVGKKFFNLLPGEIVLASLDGFSKVCDAAEIAGKNVMSTSSNVTTGLVSHKYGEEAGKATSEGLDAAGHAIGTAWTVFKLRKALNPKSVLKPTTLAKSAAKSAAAEMKAKGSK